MSSQSTAPDTDTAAGTDRGRVAVVTGSSV